MTTGNSGSDRKRWSEFFGAFRASVVRFPIVVLAAFVAFGAALAVNHGAVAWEDACIRLLLAAIVAFPTGLAAGFAGGWKSHAGAIVLAFGTWLVLPAGLDRGADAFRFFVLLLGACALASAVPGRAGNDRWWRVNVGLFTAIVLGAILCGIVELGLQLAVLSIGKLFDIHFDKLHLDLVSFGALLAAPLAVITLLPECPSEYDTEKAGIPGFWEGLCKWVLAPLGFLFNAILAAYAGLILIRWELPDGMVAMPVLSLGAYGTAAMLLLQPWRDHRTWAKWFARIYPPSFLIFSILLFLSIFERIGAYGMTFARYAALGCGLWFALAAVLFLLRTKIGSFLICGLLVLFALAAALGPFSAGALSLRSQSTRVSALLESPEAAAHSDQIKDGLRFLAANFGREPVEKITGPLNLESTGAGAWRIANEAMKKLGLDSDATALNFEWKGRGAIATTGYRFVYPVPHEKGENLDLGKTTDGQPLQIRLWSGKLSVFAGDDEVQELMPGAMPGPVSDTTSTVPLRVPFTVGGRNFCLVVMRAEITVSHGGGRSLSNIEYLVMEE